MPLKVGAQSKWLKGKSRRKESKEIGFRVRISRYIYWYMYNILPTSFLDNFHFITPHCRILDIQIVIS